MEKGERRVVWKFHEEQPDFKFFGKAQGASGITRRHQMTPSSDDSFDALQTNA